MGVIMGGGRKKDQDRQGEEGLAAAGAGQGGARHMAAPRGPRAHVPACPSAPRTAPPPRGLPGRPEAPPASRRSRSARTPSGWRGSTLGFGSQHIWVTTQGQEEGLGQNTRDPWVDGQWLRLELSCLPKPGPGSQHALPGASGHGSAWRARGACAAQARDGLNGQA